jgi:hypothetical protein
MRENARMIDFQSSTIVGRPNHRPCYSPSPGGSNERSECRFVCCSGVGSGEGELNHRGRQSALIKVGRVSPLTAAIPPARITFCPFSQNLCALCASVAKNEIAKQTHFRLRRVCETNPTCSRLIQVNPTSLPSPPGYMQSVGLPLQTTQFKRF